MSHVTDPPILFLLTDQGRVEYVDLVTCIEGGYFCGGEPLMGVENVTGFTGAEEPGYGGSYVFAQCKDGSTIDLAEALAEHRQALSGDGVLHRFALIESGYDGSILLDEADPLEEDFVLR